MTRLAVCASLFAGVVAFAQPAPQPAQPPAKLVTADWPQWMGPNRDDVWPETGVIERFPPGGPKLLWRKPIGSGYSGPAVAASRVIVTDKVLKAGGAESGDPFARVKIPAAERVLCYDARTGAEVWRYEYDCPYHISYPSGPRCTPLIDGSHVYTLGAMGHLHCLDAATGKPKWAKHYPGDFKANVPLWGFSCHPLLYKNFLICLAGCENGAIVALDRHTGDVKWKALPGCEAGYGSPILIEAGGVTQLVAWTPKALHGLNPDTGERYWDIPLEAKYGMSIMSPRRDGDLLVVGGYGNVATVVRLHPDKPTVTEVWRNSEVKQPTAGIYPINMTPFADHGVLYGVDQPGMLRAVEISNGRRLWSTFKPVLGEEKAPDYQGGGSGTAFLTRNGDRYFIFAETGDLIIAKLSPDPKTGYQEISRARLLEPTGSAFGRKVVWSHPAYSGRCVFARNDKELVCFSLAKE